MLFINVKVIENVFTDGQKHQIVERLTEAMVAIEGEPMRGVTWVVIEEIKSGDWAIGGQALTTEAVLELAAGAPVGCSHRTNAWAPSRSPGPRPAPASSRASPSTASRGRAPATYRRAAERRVSRSHARSHARTPR